MSWSRHCPTLIAYPRLFTIAGGTICDAGMWGGPRSAETGIDARAELNQFHKNAEFGCLKGNLDARAP